MNQENKLRCLKLRKALCIMSGVIALQGCSTPGNHYSYPTDLLLIRAIALPVYIITLPVTLPVGIIMDAAENKKLYGKKDPSIELSISYTLLNTNEYSVAAISYLNHKYQATIPVANNANKQTLQDLEKQYRPIFSKIVGNFYNNRQYINWLGYNMFNKWIFLDTNCNVLVSYDNNMNSKKPLNENEESQIKNLCNK